VRTAGGWMQRNRCSTATETPCLQANGKLDDHGVHIDASTQSVCCTESAAAMGAEAASCDAGWQVMAWRLLCTISTVLPTSIKLKPKALVPHSQYEPTVTRVYCCRAALLLLSRCGPCLKCPDHLASLHQVNNSSACQLRPTMLCSQHATACSSSKAPAPEVRLPPPHN
jgi:hypothetical protein